MEFKVITTEEEFLAEREAWTNLYNANEFHCGVTPFQTWEWNFYWWKNREEKDSLFIIKAFTGKSVDGYAPLIVKKKMVEFIGGRDMDYGRFLIKNRFFETISGFLDVVQKHKLGFALQEMCARDTQLHIVQRCLEGQRKYLVRRTTRTLYVETKCFVNFEDYLKTLSSAMRAKTIKVALKQGYELNIEPFNQEIKNEIVRIYTSRQTVRGGATDIEWSFPVLDGLNESGLVEVYIARAQGKAIGFLISLKGRYGKNVWLTAFDVEYSSTFPGQLLFYQVLKDGFAEGCQVVDFMRGDYDFKARWNAELDTNYSIYVYRNTFKYLKYKFWYWFRPKLKKLLYALKIKGRRKRKKHAK